MKLSSRLIEKITDEVFYTSALTSDLNIHPCGRAWFY